MSDSTTATRSGLFTQALTCLMQDDPVLKVSMTRDLQQALLADELSLEKSSAVERIITPGRPEKPLLVEPGKVSRRGFSSLKSRLNLVHAIAHIEFNAINLALDAVYRFQSMPEQYYIDWMRVAAEEAEHFSMLSAYLVRHGMCYGDEVAHNGLWEMAVKTDADVMIRMALVPRVLEARGLDVTPGMIDKLESTGDVELIRLLEKIFQDEIGHVKIGTFWFNTLCEQRGLEPEETFIALIDTYMSGAKFGPFEFEARLEAGFSESEMKRLLGHSRGRGYKDRDRDE